MIFPLPPYSSNDFNQTSLNLLRSGTVIDRRNGPQGPEVRVSFPDRDVTSDWLPVSVTGAGGMSFHFIPRVGTNVIVGFLGTGIERGHVIGSTVTENGGAVIPPSLNTLAMLADDGAQFFYNPDTGALHIGGVKTVEIIGASTVAITTGGDVNVNTSGNVNISAANVNVTASTVTLNANVQINGNLNVNGAVHSTGRMGSDDLVYDSTNTGGGIATP